MSRGLGDVYKRQAFDVAIPIPIPAPIPVKTAIPAPIAINVVDIIISPFLLFL